MSAPVDEIERADRKRSEAFQAFVDAGLTYQAAKDEVIKHEGPQSGAEYAEKVRVWRKALLAMDKAVDKLAKVIADAEVENAPAA